MRILQLWGLVLTFVFTAVPPVNARVESDSLKIVPRSEWTQVTRDSAKFKKHSGPITTIVIHHTGAVTHAFRPAEQSLDNSIRRWHMEFKHWGDAAYHYLIDVHGTIYEGRPEAYQGDSATNYVLDRKLLICVLGDYRTKAELLADGMAPEDVEKQLSEYGELALSPETARALKGLVIAKARELHVTPEHIGTHRQFADTSCPGANIQTWFETVAKVEIEQALQQ